MQSKIQNPMSSPNWTKAVRTQTAEEQYNDQVRKIKDKQRQLNTASFDAMLPATRNDLSHEERQAKKGALVRKFKLGIDGLQDSAEGAKRDGKYADILASSFRPRTNASTSPNPAS